MAVKLADTLAPMGDFEIAKAEDISVEIGGDTKMLQDAIDNGEIGGGDSSFTGTHAEWEALLPTEKAKYTTLYFTDDVEGEPLYYTTKFPNGFMSIAYSFLYDDDSSWNTAEHYEYSATHGFNTIKGDVRVSSDGKLIMCHDAGFTLNSNGKIISFNSGNYTPISSLTESQCLALQHNGTDNYVVGFETFIQICRKHGMLAYITIRDEYISTLVQEMFRIIDKYSYRDCCVVNSFTYSSLQAVRNFDKTIALSHVQTDGAIMTNTMVDNCAILGNCALCMFNFPNYGKYTGIVDSVMEYARQKNVRVYEAQVPRENVEELIKLGVTGIQMLNTPSWGEKKYDVICENVGSYRENVTITTKPLSKYSKIMAAISSYGSLISPITFDVNILKLNKIQHRFTHSSGIVYYATIEYVDNNNILVYCDSSDEESLQSIRKIVIYGIY